MILTWLSLMSSIFSFSFLDTWSWSFSDIFDYNFDNQTITQSYNYPTFSQIENITSTSSIPWIDSSLPIIEFLWWVSNYSNEVFCSSFPDWSLSDYTLWSETYWIWWDSINSVRDEWTWTQYENIDCFSTFDHSRFQSQQLFDIKNTIFYIFISIWFFFFFYFYSIIWKK